MDLPIAFVDLETTGATATSDRITEIGIVEVSDRGISEWSSLVNPQAPISEFIERLTGISNAMVADAPTFAELAEEIRTRLDGRLFAAHNARFDYGFLRREFQRLGGDFRATVLCTVKLSRKLQPQHQRHNLDALIARHGLVADGRHRALADAQLIQQLWDKLRLLFPAEAIEAAVRELTARPRVPPQLDPDVIDDLIPGHGVYVFYDGAGQPLYVGRSRQLRKRVLAHFSAAQASPRKVDLAPLVQRIEATAAAGEIGAQLLERRLLKELQPPHNHVAADSGSPCAWRLVDAGGGRWFPELVAIDEIGGEPLYGLFHSSREARRKLAQVAADQNLCLSILGLEAAAGPCVASAEGRCKGACCGREPLSVHSARLMAGIARWRLMSWPFAGAAVIREGDSAHLVDRWRYLGSADDESELYALLAARPPEFDADLYGLLLRFVGRMTPWPSSPVSR